MVLKKIVTFYPNKGIDCWLDVRYLISPYFSKVFSPRATDLLEKIRLHMVAGPSTAFTRKALVGGTLIRKSSNICKSIVRIEPSKLYPYSVCQPMPTRVSTRFEFDEDLQK